MGDIKVYKKLTYVTLKDGRVLVTEATPEQIDEYLATHSHIMIEGEGHSKFSIESYRPMNIDDLEGFILDQPKEIQSKVRQKRKRLRDTLGREMTLSYAQGYVKDLFLGQGNVHTSE